MLSKGILLFGLNFIDALLTLFWVRNNIAEEGNALMAGLLEIGDTPFLAAKLMMGATASLVFYYWSDLKVARFGLWFALIVYFGVIFIHFLTGIGALWL